MQILFDQGTPAPLRQLLPGHEVATAYERGWSTLKNGELLAAAETQGFQVLVTTDTNLKYQQNLVLRPSKSWALKARLSRDQWARFPEGRREQRGMKGK